ncbi:MAG: endolytic transglycosylase MltG [Clostridia bacterium]|nr:endolytic transglycosylase MltG [Clostridia bacterium]
MAEDNNKKPFKVTISDEDYMKPDELDELNSRLSENGHSRPKPKFEVNILDDDDGGDELANLSENEYKGEIYFSGVKAVKNNNQVNSSSAKKKKKRKKGIGAFAFFLIVVIVITTSITAFSLSCLNDILAFSRSEDTVTINIPLNADTNDIIDILADNGLVKQRTFCKLFYQLLSTLLNKKTPVYLSGVYYVEKNMGLEGYLYEFRESQAGKDTVIVSIPEGWSIYQICERLEKFGVCSSKKIISSLKGTSFEYDFIDKIYADPARTFKLEGYLYPNTYEFYADSDPNSVIRKFLDEFEAKWSDKYQKQADKLGLSMDEIIIIASIIQREAADKDQMKDISSVIHNRLSHMASWPTLNCDSTDTYISKYILPNVPASESLIYTQKYSTYNNQGLPPGPICNPGDDAINAALYPNDTNYYFFRHDKYGKIYLASTQAQHDANANAVLRANSK